MRSYVVFIITGVALLMYSISGTSVSVAFPVIVTDLGTSLVLTGWVISGYNLMFIAVMPLAGKVSEVLGRNFTFILCVLLFTIGSALCAIAPTIELLILARIIQACGGGGFIPCASGIISTEFPRSRQRAIGLMASIMPVGTLIGPNLGGWIVESFGWRSVFWINLPLGIVILGLLRLLLRTDTEKESPRIDFVGAGFLLGSLFSFMLAMTELGNFASGASWGLITALFMLSIIFMNVYLRWERRVKEPLIALEIMREKPFLAANIFNLIYGGCAFGVFSLVPLYIVSAYNMSVLESGILLTPRSIATILLSVITSFGLDRWGYRRPMLLGVLFLVLSLFLLALEPHDTTIMGFHFSTITLLVLIMTLSGIGVGLCSPAANNACIELMPDKIATITGLRGMFRYIGGAFIISIDTIILHNIKDIHQAFYMVFLTAMILVMLICIPAIFAMPSSPNSSANKLLKRS